MTMNLCSAVQSAPRNVTKMYMPISVPNLGPGDVIWETYSTSVNLIDYTVKTWRLYIITVLFEFIRPPPGIFMIKVFYTACSLLRSLILADLKCVLSLEP